MDSRARRMVDHEVTGLLVSAKEVAFLFVDHELLDHLGLLHDVQVETARRLSSPFVTLDHVSKSFI